MSHPRRFSARPVAVAAVSVLVLSLSACSSDEEKSDENRADACAAVTEFQTTLDAARTNLTADSTVEEWRTARDALRSDVDALEEALEKVGEDSADKIDEAWDRFTDALDDVDDQATAPEAGQTLVEEMQSVQDARAEAASGLDCS